ncbi:ABC transporter ATP-binding protein [Saccharomonospora xinjiangensis]|uniref:ABC transporter ATP-binding protein n=1 Tax=Saccharomonospora xinjiangensis TaxID=75294 RepID=UPI00106FAFD3|nr:ABC transporter ATP-binding protein [Saccharomonospora xinjiangensis]QBQ58638.1 Daunorubicin/doxorubicin resistance ATP-binding protein DrrA [Saccharomonospora xinjiangensis]
MREVLSAKGLGHRYGTTTALDGVDLTVEAGECVALLGPNGAGKTTLVNLVVGLLRPQRGEVRLAGGDPRNAATRRRLGVVQQELDHPATLKVGELVTGAAVRGGRSRSSAGPVLAELELTGLARRRAAKLSGGQKQRVRLAMALVNDPALLVLDEPTVGLDVATRKRFWQILAERRAKGAGILLTTHLTDEAATVADRVVVLDRGRTVAAGTPAELVSRLPDRTVLARTNLDDDLIRRLPEVASFSRDDEGVRIGTRSPEALLRRLLADDPELSGLLVEGASLAEAVMTLTGHPKNTGEEVLR